MFPFDVKVPLKKNKSKGTNACKYIILHHTGTYNFKGELNALSGNTDRQVSCHFLIGPDGKSAKIGEPTDIMWHVGVSRWKDEKTIGNSLNHLCLGIEITGPDNKGGFSPEQKVKVKELVQHLMAVYSIPKDRVLRHCDLTHSQSSRGILWEPGTVGRKWDLSIGFFPLGNFTTRRDTLVPKEI